MSSMKQIKQELTDACELAVKDWLSTIRGANFAGPHARVIRVGPGVIQVFVKRAAVEAHGPHDIVEITVKQKW